MMAIQNIKATGRKGEFLHSKQHQSQKQFIGLDVCKLIAALSVIIIHCDLLAAPNILTPIRYLLESVTSLAVPLFFAISGFLCFYKAHNNPTIEIARTKQSAHSVLWLYIAWTIIYFPASVTSFIQEGQLNLSAIPRYIHKIVFVGEWQLWFLLSMSIAYFLLYCALMRHIKKIYIGLGATVIYAIGLIIQYCQSLTLPTGSIFKQVIFFYNKIFASPRVLCDGIFFISLGMAVALFYQRNPETRDGFSPTWKMMIYIVSIALFLITPAISSSNLAFLIIHAIVSTLAVMFILLSCLTFNNQNSSMFKNLRTSSAVMYLSHMYFIFCFNYFFDGRQLLPEIPSQILSFVFVLLCTLILSTAVIYLSHQSAFIRKLFRC